MKKSKLPVSWFKLGTICFLLLFLAITTSSIPSLQGKGKPKPVSTPLILSDSGNIVTCSLSRSNRQLKVWGHYGEVYENVWTADDVYYGAVAIGDIDGDSLKEIVGINFCKIYLGKGRSNYKYKVYLNVYKEGQEGIWITTYSDRDDNNIIEEAPLYYIDFEIALDDLNEKSGNKDEIILRTSRYLAVYEYDHELGKLKKIASRQLSADVLSNENEPFWLRSVTVGDIDGDTVKDILAVGNILPGTENRGYLFICNLPASGSELDLSSLIEVPYNFADNSLRAGNIDGDNQLELCTTAFFQEYDDASSTTKYYSSYILIFDYTTNGVEMYDYVLVPNDTSWPWNHLDVGNLEGDPSQDEIAVLMGNLNQLWIYSWEDGLSFPADGLPTPTIIDLNPSAGISDIVLGDTNYDEINEINIAGTYKLIKPPNKRSSYLAVYKYYNGTYQLLWDTVDADGSEITCLAVDKKI
ncbi:MAG: hypothetical protein DRJ11_12340 [Candidatus Aminicenantes bacterium]|nr:MAG: hypothetical protein DRJ11_12340 [Candidatus Aminicenantes bacterium]